MRMAISTDLLQALFLLIKFCTIQNDCSKCPLKEFCSKQIQDW